MSDELKPCPWPDCDGEAVHLVPQVVCNKCGRTAGCQVGSHQDNRDAWNSLPRTVQAAPSDREKRLESALEFYADPYTYRPVPRTDRLGPPSPLVMQDQGDRARAALADTTTTNDDAALADDPAVVARNHERAAQLFPVWHSVEPTGKPGLDDDE